MHIREEKNAAGLARRAAGSESRTTRRKRGFAGPWVPQLRVRPLNCCFAADEGLTVRTEPADRMLFSGKRHLRRVLDTSAAHYTTQRPHRARQLPPPRPETPVSERVYGGIRRRAVLGGLINQYELAA